MIVVPCCHQAGHGRQQPGALQDLGSRRRSSNSLRIPRARGGRALRYARLSRPLGRRKSGRPWPNRCATSRSAVTSATKRWTLRRCLRVFAHNGHKPSWAHVLLVLFSPLHSWKTRKLHRKVLMMLINVLLRLANKWGRSASLSLGET